jgi:hypothetical protein
VARGTSFWHWPRAKRHHILHHRITDDDFSACFGLQVNPRIYLCSGAVQVAGPGIIEDATPGAVEVTGLTTGSVATASTLVVSMATSSGITAPLVCSPIQINSVTTEDTTTLQDKYSRQQDVYLPLGWLLQALALLRLRLVVAAWTHMLPLSGFHRWQL